MMLAADGPYGGGGGTALNGSLIWGGSNPSFESGTNWVSGYQFSYDAVGGVPPYTFSNSIISNPSGKINLFAVSDPHDNGTFSVFGQGFSLNESESATFRITIQDSVGTTLFRNASVTFERTS